jgi:hypothetical protein
MVVAKGLVDYKLVIKVSGKYLYASRITTILITRNNRNNTNYIIALIIKIPELLTIIFAKNNCARRKKIAYFTIFLCKLDKQTIFFLLAQLFFAKIIVNNSGILIISAILYFDFFSSHYYILNFFSHFPMTNFK